MAVLNSLDWASVRRHYDERHKMHLYLCDLHQREAVHEFSSIALGITTPDGNYSAAEHGLGPKIIGTNVDAENKVFNLADNFVTLDSARSVPDLVRRAGLKYLQIGVGSEISCMVNPNVCWVANTRTIWTHLVIKHADSIAKADVELALYREADVTSEMAYQMWSAIHAELGVALTRIAEIGQQLAAKAEVFPGEITFLWADAIASQLYNIHHR